MDSNKIRQDFLDFFRGKQHEIVSSSPVVPFDDPTLMFTNAGMNQFKDVFLGTGSRPYKRSADTQKCIRAGGKHNDLDDVGQDTYHHTFFEMLGNWSFGDYFKKEAIEWAWELLTKVWGIDKSRLHATYFEGNAAEGVEADNEARDLWAKVAGLPASHIHPGNKKDNFWEMGDTGPCGPCSEIHIDLTPDKSGGHLVNKGDHRVMEIWNLVFIQFNRGADSKLTPLPAKHVDTGMGFERLCAVLQGTRENRIGQMSNYDTGVFTPIFAAIQKRTNAPDYKGTLPTDKSTIDNRQSTIMTDVSYRVIADHIRCLTFALTDGAIPSNEGRGYVLRRILRRAVRYGRQYMNMHEPFLCDLVAPLVEHMSGAFPELRSGPDKNRPRDNVKYVSEILRDEEASFLKTLDRGITLFDEAIEESQLEAVRHYLFESPGAYGRGWHVHEIETGALFRVHLANPTFSGSALKACKNETIQLEPNGPSLWVLDQSRNRTLDIGPIKLGGEAAFKLHDTYGFPIDLTVLMAEERGLSVDVDSYEKLMREARDRARAKKDMEAPEYFEYMKVQGTPTHFVGYETLETDTAFVDLVSPVRDEHSVFSQTMKKDEVGAIALSKSPFYAEQGGQVGDSGIIEGIDEEWIFDVEDTRKVGPTTVHIGKCVKGIIKPINLVTGGFGPEYPTIESPIVGLAKASVNKSRRERIMQNHTATHVLNWALREVLEIEGGGKVDQKGSLVDPEKTRFDFSHNKPLTDEELDKIERLCGEQIAAKLPVYAASREEDFQDQKKAREINTLRAVFGEKYPDRVRVVSIGAPVEDLLRAPKNPKWMKYSVEFCGGTHVKNTSEIEHFVLVSEEGVAKGVRRVVGISGQAARAAESLGEQLLDDARQQGNKATRQQGVDAVWMGEFQKRLSEAQIPIRLRRQIQTVLLDVQKAMKEQAKESAAVSGDAALDAVKKLYENAQTVGGLTVVVGEVPPASPDALRGAIDWIRNKTESSAVLLGFASEGKVTLIAGMSKAAVDRGLKAGDLIKEICPLVGGKGGGRPDMAQGGGSDPTGLSNALTRGQEWIANKLS